MKPEIDYNKIRIMYDAIGCCLKVHKELGTKVLERAYLLALQYELRQLGYKAEEEIDIDMHYKDAVFTKAFRADLIVNDQLIIELKATKELEPQHHSQLRTYMQLGRFPYGLLVNFHSPYLMKGMSRKCLYEDQVLEDESGD